MESYGALIERARLAAGMDPADLAARLGLRSRASVYAIEKGEQMPSLKQITLLVSALPISAEELLRACGVPLNPPAAAKLPRDLVDVLLQLGPDQRRIVLRVARGLLAEDRSPQ